MKAAEEGVELAEGAMEALGRVSGGDLRRGITTLQSAVRLKVCILPCCGHPAYGSPGSQAA